jgi:hypothetical protein
MLSQRFLLIASALLFLGVILLSLFLIGEYGREPFLEGTARRASHQVLLARP